MTYWNNKSGTSFKNSTVTYISGSTYVDSATAFGPTYTESETAPSMANGLMILSITAYQSSSDVISSVTYNGRSMTELFQLDWINDTQGHHHVFYLTSPDAGSYDLVFTGPFTRSYDLAYTIIYLENVDQTTPIGDTDTDEDPGTVTSVSCTVASEAGNLVVATLAIYDEYPSSATTTGTGQTIRQLIESVQVGDYSDSYISTTPGSSSVTTGWSFDSQANPAQTAFEVNSAP